MTSPPLSERTQSVPQAHGLERLPSPRAIFRQMEAAYAAAGKRISSKRLRELVAQYAAGGNVCDPVSWLQKRGDLLVLQPTYRDVAARSNWRQRS